MDSPGVETGQSELYHLLRQVPRSVVVRFVFVVLVLVHPLTSSLHVLDPPVRRVAPDAVVEGVFG